MYLGISLFACSAKRICIITCTAWQYDGREREACNDLVGAYVCDKTLRGGVNEGNDRGLENERLMKCSYASYVCVRTFILRRMWPTGNLQLVAFLAGSTNLRITPFAWSLIAPLLFLSKWKCNFHSAADWLRFEG